MSFFTSYSTIKFVRINDVRLAALRLLLLSAIVGYVVVIEMAQLGGYLASSPVEGAVEFSLREPTQNGCDPSVKGCESAFLPLHELEYCEQAAAGRRSGRRYAGKVWPCQIYEADAAKAVRESSLIVWTRATTIDQRLACDASPTGSTCPRTYENVAEDPPTPFYVAQAEAFTVLIEHAVTASQICEHQSDHDYACSAQALDYRGRLYSRNAALCGEEFLKDNSFADLQELQSSAPCFVGPNRTRLGQDFFSLDVLLRSAGATLDDCVNGTAKRTTEDCVTYRHSGANLLIDVVWGDFRPFLGLVEPFYYYSPRLVGKRYKEVVPFYDPYRSNRTLLKAHGVRISVLISGNFHRFQFFSFLITFTTALGLFAVARKVVDFAMLHGLPEKREYRTVKFEPLRRDDDVEEGADDDEVSSDRINVRSVVNYGSSSDR